MDRAPGGEKTTHILDRLAVILSELDELLEHHAAVHIAAAMAVLEP